MIGFRTMRLAAALVALSAISLSGQEPATGERRPGQTRPMTAHRPAVPGIHGLITTGHPLASMAGARVMLKGGNAFDAAVAVLATLNVTEPAMSGAGGNGFMTIYEKKTGKFYSLNATGQAPKALKPEAMTAELLNEGIKASLTPGLFGGWILLLDKFGTKSLSELLEPAIEYADHGHPIDEKIARDIEGRRRVFEKFATSAKIFLTGGKAPAAGQMFKNLDLARTFRRVVEAEQQALKQGKSRSQALQAAYDRFYKGDIAQDFVKFFRENDGLLTLEDLAAYKPKLVEPIHSTYRGYDIYTSPSTSRGGFEMLMQLNIIEGFDVKKFGHNSADTLHLMAESIKLAKADIYKYVADPVFTKIPVEGLLSKPYAAGRRRMIDMNNAMAYPAAGRPEQAPNTVARQQAANHPTYHERSHEGDTTSFSIVDQAGNVLSVTPTLGSGFGTGVVVGITGLFFNNGMRIGSTSPYPDNVNYVGPGKIPLLNNSPLLVFKDGRFVMSFGTPGGETIGQTQFQMAVNVLDFAMPVQQAIEAPRFSLDASPNFYKPGAEITMRIESRISPDIIKGLEAKGHKVQLSGAWSVGSMQAIVANPDTGAMTAGGDPRRTLYAIGW